jgi:hypothetical protein
MATGSPNPGGLQDDFQKFRDFRGWGSDTLDAPGQVVRGALGYRLPDLPTPVPPGRVPAPLARSVAARGRTAWVAAGAPPLFATERERVEWDRRLRLAGPGGKRLLRKLGVHIAASAVPARRAAIERMSEDVRGDRGARELAVQRDPEYRAACAAAWEAFWQAHPRRRRTTRTHD